MCVRWRFIYFVTTYKLNDFNLNIFLCVCFYLEIFIFRYKRWSITSMSFRCHPFFSLFKFSSFFSLCLRILWMFSSVMQRTNTVHMSFQNVKIFIFISHKKDIIFAWPCKIFCHQFELTYTCGYKLARTISVRHEKERERWVFLAIHRNNFNFIQFSTFSSQWCHHTIWYSKVYKIIRLSMLCK